MNALVDWLEDLNSRDTRVRAVLRRSLAFDPGAFPMAYPYVEPFVGNSQNAWRRQMLYLVAGLWASHWRDGRGNPVSLPRAAAAYQALTQSASTERRFINLLDADPGQLPHRLRQMVSLLKDQPIDFDDLFDGLLFWNDDRKKTQNRWARQFYQSAPNAISDESPSTDGDLP
jgi:CRISPR system Cascade subunit CasB